MTGNTRKGVCNSDGCKTLTSEWLWNLLLWESLGLVNFTWLFTAKMRQISQSICYSRIKVKMIRATHYWATRTEGCCSSAMMHFDPGCCIWGLIKGRRVSGVRGWVNFCDTSLQKPRYVLSLLGQTEGVIRGLGPIGWRAQRAWTRACIIANISKFHHWDEENIPECKTRSFLLYWPRPHAKICLLVCSFLSHWWFIHGETCLISQQGVFGPGVCYKPHAGRRIGGPQIKIWSEGKAMDQMTFLK